MILLIATAIPAAAGYIAAVLCYYFFTYAITSSSPQLVSERGRFRNSYLVANFIGWTICALIGSCLAAKVSTFPILFASRRLWLSVLLLACLLAGVSWANPIEATEEQFMGMTRLLMPLLAFVGVFAGYLLLVKVL